MMSGPAQSLPPTSRRNYGQVPGLVDLRVQQPMDYPMYQVDIDRTKAEQGGYAARDVGQSMLNSLSGSFQITQCSS